MTEIYQLYAVINPITQICNRQFKESRIIAREIYASTFIPADFVINTLIVY